MNDELSASSYIILSPTKPLSNEHPCFLIIPPISDTSSLRVNGFDGNGAQSNDDDMVLKRSYEISFKEIS
ncbi:hypothetical protein SNEBB_002933 [Seison nebaliae]|nr:hypothetical protein SNEBB_002933 [Seison nebaliae]